MIESGYIHVFMELFSIRKKIIPYLSVPLRPRANYKYIFYGTSLKTMWHNFMHTNYTYILYRCTKDAYRHPCHSLQDDNRVSTNSLLVWIAISSIVPIFYHIKVETTTVTRFYLKKLAILPENGFLNMYTHDNAVHSVFIITIIIAFSHLLPWYYKTV